MSSIARVCFVHTSKLAEAAKSLFLRAIHAVMDARARRIQYELEFRHSFDAYREGKDIPPLHEDLKSGS